MTVSSKKIISYLEAKIQHDEARIAELEEALRAAVAASTNPDTNQYLLVEPTEEMEHVLNRDFNEVCDEFEIFPEEYRRGEFLDVLVRAALAAAQPEKKEG